MNPEMKSITDILEAGARSAMSIEQIIEQEIKDWMASDERKLMLIGVNYYKGDSDIIKNKRKVIGPGGVLVEATNLANNKLPHGFIRKLVDQKAGYLLGKPLSIQTDNTNYEEALSSFFDKKMLRTLKSLGKEATKKGRAWLHVYYNELGQLSFMTIPSEEIIPLWRDAAHTELEAVIRVYDTVVYLGTEKKTIRKVEFWHENGVDRYTLGIADGVANNFSSLMRDVESEENTGHFNVDIEGNVQPLNWERIPFICFKYNEDELPLIKGLKSLVDDYDKKKSDNSNNVEDEPNSILILTNYDGEDLGEFRRNLSTYRAVKVQSGAGYEGGVESLSVDINNEAYQNHVEALRKDIYEFGRGVDTQSNSFGNSPSGIALRFLYSDLDMDANDLETEFQASLEQLTWFIDQHLYNTTKADYSDVEVTYIFNRDILINETETVENAKNSVGILSDETVVSNHPWTSNVQDELKRIEMQRKAEMDQFNNYPTLDKESQNEDQAE